ncbi:MAG: anaerobic C4-dicarboxylate transporter family protein [Candidatus Binatia bacterium]
MYPLMPVIHDICYAERIRPERAVSMITVASQVAVFCSPVSAAAAAMVVVMEPHGFPLGKILLVMWPASLIALMVGSVVMLRWGKELDEDPIYLQRKAEGRVPPIPTKSVALPPTAFPSAMIFFAGVLAIVVLGLFPHCAPPSERATRRRSSVWPRRSRL